MYHWWICTYIARIEKHTWEEKTLHLAEIISGEEKKQDFQRVQEELQMFYCYKTNLKQIWQNVCI